MQPVVLTIAGSDSSGGAGLQADLKAIAANGGYGASVVTAITAQNTREVTRAEPVERELVRAQLDAVFDDLDVAAVKSGMLAVEAIIEECAAGLAARRAACYVCDPVMVAESGAELLPPDCVGLLKSALLPLATLVTPNAAEAARLTGVEVRTPRDAERAGRILLDDGPGAVLVKGGHLAEGKGTDVLVTAAGCEWLESGPVDSPHTHGSGCTYASVIATWLAHGRELFEAVRIAKAFVTEAIRHGLPVGRGRGPTDPLWLLGVGGARTSRIAAAIERVREPAGTDE